MKIGDTLYITIESDDHKGEKYRCKLVDLNEEQLFVDYPIHEESNRTIFLPENSNLTISYRENQSIFMFSTHLIKRTIKSIPTLVLYLPPREEHTRIQRRKHVRIETSVDVAVHCEQASFTPFTSRTKDISGGGVSIYIKDSFLNKEIPIKLAMVLKTGKNNFDYIFAKAKFIRYKQYKNQVITASLQFIEIDEQDQQKIISFCFMKEREQRKQEVFLEKK